jgi:rubredoxin
MTKNTSVVDWLLEENNMPVRYRTLTALMGEPRDTPRVREAWARIPDDRKVKRIFKAMHPDGYWLHRGKGATVDYAMSKSTHFVLAALAELGLDREDARVAKAADRYLNLDPPDTKSHQSCLYAYNLRTFVMLGYRDDPRVQARIEVLLNDTRHDGGYLCDRSTFNAQTKSCIRGSIKALTAFAMLPDLWETPRCKQLVDYFLRRRVFYRMNRPDEVIRGELTSVIFPFVISGSLLESLWALSTMGYGDHPALQPAWEQLAIKTDDQGRVVLDWYPPTLFTPGPKGEVNKWTTLYAQLALAGKAPANA